MCLHCHTQWSHVATKSRCLPALRRRGRVAHALDLTVVAQGINWACITSFSSRKYTCYSLSRRLSHFGFFLLSEKLSFPTRFELILFEEWNCSFLSPVTVHSRTSPPPPPLKMRKTNLESLQRSWYPVCRVCHDEFFRWGPVVTADVAYKSRILTRQFFKTISYIHAVFTSVFGCDGSTGAIVAMNVGSFSNSAPFYDALHTSVSRRWISVAECFSNKSQITSHD